MGEDAIQRKQEEEEERIQQEKDQETTWYHEGPEMLKRSRLWIAGILYKYVNWQLIFTQTSKSKYRSYFLHWNGKITNIIFSEPTTGHGNRSLRQFDYAVNWAIWNGSMHITMLWWFWMSSWK